MKTPWEYKVVLIDLDEGGSLSEMPARTKALEKTLNSLGGFGWELVEAIMPDVGSGEFAFIFKRPLTPRD